MAQAGRIQNSDDQISGADLRIIEQERRVNPASLDRLFQVR